MLNSSNKMALESSSDLELAERVSRKERSAVEIMMRRYNARLFRAARSVLKDDGEAEDALQEAYIDVIRRIDSFQGASSLGTWLTRVVINRSLMRLRSQRRHRVLVPFVSGGTEGPGPREESVVDQRLESPLRAVQRSEIRRLIEQKIDELPLDFRTVFVLREVEDLAMAEIGELLEIPTTTVRTRLFRARRLLRTALESDIEAVTGDLYSFGGDHCDRLVKRVLAVLDAEGTLLS